jgi:hypothetical protein
MDGSPETEQVDGRPGAQYQEANSGDDGGEADPLEAGFGAQHQEADAGEEHDERERGLPGHVAHLRSAPARARLARSIASSGADLSGRMLAIGSSG